jgi:hypothetical protein
VDPALESKSSALDKELESKSSALDKELESKSSALDKELESKSSDLDVFEPGWSTTTFPKAEDLDSNSFGTYSVSGNSDTLSRNSIQFARSSLPGILNRQNFVPGLAQSTRSSKRNFDSPGLAPTT